ncbi:hypothetical protein NTGBS_260004 [Candidatus Nitrotoga sp. BS]|nr:hypothetical protein NTGBS_260004 [Candidatus Nitrotoga sp. BS]
MISVSLAACAELLLPLALNGPTDPEIDPSVDDDKLLSLELQYAFFASAYEPCMKVVLTASKSPRRAISRQN